MENAINTEVFKPIKGYPCYYVSNMGRIWNAKTQRYLKPSQKKDYKNPQGGYWQINLTAADGKRKKEYLHRLVALTFVENPEGKTEVDHIDRDKNNNVASNLRWVTRSENERNKNTTKIIEVYNLKDELLAECNGTTAAAEFAGVGIASVYAVLRNDYDSCKGFKFKRKGE